MHLLAMALNRLNAVLAARMNLTQSEMATVDHLGTFGPLTPKELREHLRLTSGAVTGVIDRLERAGHVRRQQHPRDRRSIVIELVPETLAHAGEQILPLVQELDALGKRRSAGDRQVVATYLEELTEAIERLAREPPGNDTPPA